MSVATQSTTSSRKPALQMSCFITSICETEVTQSFCETSQHEAGPADSQITRFQDGAEKFHLTAQFAKMWQQIHGCMSPGMTCLKGQGQDAPLSVSGEESLVGLDRSGIASTLHRGVPHTSDGNYRRRAGALESHSRYSLHLRFCTPMCHRQARWHIKI